MTLQFSIHYRAIFGQSVYVSIRFLRMRAVCWSTLLPFTLMTAIAGQVRHRVSWGIIGFGL